MKNDWSEDPSRRRFLKSAAVVTGITALSSMSLVNRAFAAVGGKAPQAAVKYQDQPRNNQQCSECMYFLAPESKGAPGHCQVVGGDIAANGWCMLFSPKQ